LDIDENSESCQSTSTDKGVKRRRSLLRAFIAFSILEESIIGIIAIIVILLFIPFLLFPGLICVIIGLGLFTVLKIHFFTSSSEIPIEHPVIGQLAIVLDDFFASLNQWKGKVRLRGEIWRAVANTPIKKDSTVKVIDVEGLCLTVQPKPTLEN